MLTEAWLILSARHAALHILILGVDCLQNKQKETGWDIDARLMLYAAGLQHGRNYLSAPASRQQPAVQSKPSVSASAPATDATAAKDPVPAADAKLSKTQDHGEANGTALSQGGESSNAGSVEASADASKFSDPMFGRQTPARGNQAAKGSDAAASGHGLINRTFFSRCKTADEQLAVASLAAGGCGLLLGGLLTALIGRQH